jgi:hypothetical protein
MKAFNFHTVIDNSIVERLVKDGFFEQLFGVGIKAEEERKAKLGFRSGHRDTKAPRHNEEG